MALRDVLSLPELTKSWLLSDFGAYKNIRLGTNVGRFAEGGPLCDAVECAARSYRLKMPDDIAPVGTIFSAVIEFSFAADGDNKM